MAVSSAREVVVFNVVGAAVAVGALLLLRVSMSDSFGFIILIESTGLMLVGGALGLASQATARKVTEFLTKRKVDPKEVQSSELKAALYALTGVLLFAEGAVLAAVLG